MHPKAYAMLKAFEAQYGPVIVRRKAWWVPTPRAYATTIGSTIHLPDFDLISTPSGLPTLAHELQHVYQYRTSPVWFVLGYFFPQLLAILGFLGFIWWPLALFAVLILPWPAYFRARFEGEGYAVSRYVWQRLGRKLPEDHYAKKFKGWTYYWMWPIGDRPQEWTVSDAPAMITLVDEVL